MSCKVCIVKENVLPGKKELPIYFREVPSIDFCYFFDVLRYLFPSFASYHLTGWWISTNKKLILFSLSILLILFDMFC